VILRDQFEVARRKVEAHGTTTAVEEVRARVALALRIVGEELRPIDNATARNDIAWLVRTFPDWKAQRLLLRDEARELKRLFDHVELFLTASSG